ncbi:MAG: hypothetical protein RL033_4593 [Pseudomonadota bacterium]|jgi:hypothetical protein
MYGSASRRGRRLLGWLLALASLSCAGRGAAPVPAAVSVAAKYPASTLPLSREHGYLQRAPAPDFWALMPHYMAQRDDVSCSLATLAMLVNGARQGTPLGSDEPLVTQARLFDRVRSDVWRRGLASGGPGVTLDQLGVLAEQSLRAFHIAARVRVQHVPEPSPDALAELRSLLRANEASTGDWLLLNFAAQQYVGVGDYGHIAPVGAYDEAQHRVLVLDPDREWYEPYWISDEVALAGMATLDVESGQPRGYVYVAM